MTANVRFWHWHSPGDQWVKLTLKPGHSLYWHHAGATEEGYNSSWEQWTHDTDEGVVLCEFGSNGYDCDGRYDSGGAVVCPIDRLQALEPVTDWDGTVGPPRADWQSRDSWQRDYEAEKAGY